VAVGDILVDSNVILDVLSEDPDWAEWSSARLAEHGRGHALIINPIVYAEVSVRYATIQALDEALSSVFFRREPLPWEAAFIAGKAFVRYRQAGGPRLSLLPDFFIGAHEDLHDLAILTRDPQRYRTYFPSVALLTP